jgi:aconitate hydratase
VLPLTFADPADYDRLRRDDRLSFIGLDKLAPGQKVEARITHADGSQETFLALHSLTRDQIAWFMAGSALNLIRRSHGSAVAGQ